MDRSPDSIDGRDGAQAGTEPGQPDVVVLDRHVQHLFETTGIATHVKFDGVSRTAASVLARGTDRVSRCTTVRCAATEAETYAAWCRQTGQFKSVAWTLEPMAVADAELAQNNGRDPNLVVRFKVEEQRPKWDIGIMTSATAVPELNFDVKNLLGRPWAASLVYLPSLSAVPSGELRLSSQNPSVGDRCEYVVGRRIESRLTSNRPCPIADNETVTEAKVVISSTAEAAGIPVTSTSTFGLQDRTLSVREAADLSEQSKALYGSDSKLFWRGLTRLSTAQFHQHPRYAAMYGLPVGGMNSALRLEVFDVARNDKAGGAAAALTHAFIKPELQITKYIQLLPAAILDLNLTLGGVYSAQSVVDAVSPACALGSAAMGVPPAHVSDVPLADRVFASWRHVRGFRALGPNTLGGGGVTDSADGAARAKPRVFRALGGDTMWAASAVLNLPFLLYPENGFFATHLFANVGNVRNFGGLGGALANWRELFQGDGLTASVGAGLTLTAMPGLFSAMGAGRLEANVCYPFTWGRGRLQPRSDLFESGGAGIFERFKWGLHWSSYDG